MGPQKNHLSDMFFEHPKHILKLMDKEKYIFTLNFFLLTYVFLTVIDSYIFFLLYFKYHPNDIKLGDNCIQNFHLRRYIVRYMVVNFVFRQRVNMVIPCIFLSN